MCEPSNLERYPDSSTLITASFSSAPVVKLSAHGRRRTGVPPFNANSGRERSICLICISRAPVAIESAWLALSLVTGIAQAHQTDLYPDIRGLP